MAYWLDVNRCPSFSSSVFEISWAWGLASTSHGTRSTTRTPAFSKASTLSGLFDSNRTPRMPNGFQNLRRKREVPMIGLEAESLIGFDSIEALNPAIRRPAVWP